MQGRQPHPVFQASRAWVQGFVEFWSSGFGFWVQGFGFGVLGGCGVQE